MQFRHAVSAPVAIARPAAFAAFTGTAAFTAVAMAATLVTVAAPASAEPPSASATTTTPGLGPIGTATMHGDAASSDTTPNPGPGAGPIASRYIPLGGACPTILQGADGMPQALCTNIIGREPVVHLLDPASGDPLASITLAKGSLLGGVYAYIDDADRMVMVDGNGTLLRIGHHRGADGAWQLAVDEATPLADAITAHCGEPGCDAVNSLMPDAEGRVWLATGHGLVGVVDPATGAVATTQLGTPDAPETVANSISTAPHGTAVTTDRATYLLTAGDDDAPHVQWRQQYDRGPARKPGQLSWGSGASPTFFGPADGDEYVVITDNAVPREHVIVYRTGDGSQVCSLPVFPSGASGTEDSPIAAGRSIYVGSTYGYPYPALPEGAGPAEPPAAPIAGGMARIDLTDDGAGVGAGVGTGCTLVWENDLRSAAVPRLSLADDTIYTITRDPLFPDAAGSLGGAGSVSGPGSGGGSAMPGPDMLVGLADSYHYTAIDADTGAVRAQQHIGSTAVFDTLEMVGTITPDRVMYQGTITGVLRIAPQ